MATATTCGATADHRANIESAARRRQGQRLMDRSRRVVMNLDRQHRWRNHYLAILLTAAMLQLASGCSAALLGSATGSAATVDDASITRAVEAQLRRDSLTRDADIDIDTERGVVTLSGKVSSNEARQRAATLTREVAGVTSVRNQLRLVE